MPGIELLPCPACAGAAVAGASTNPGGPTTVWVGCPRCQKRVADAPTMDEAAAAWNRLPRAARARRPLGHPEARKQHH